MPALVGARRLHVLSRLGTGGVSPFAFTFKGLPFTFGGQSFTYGAP